MTGLARSGKTVLLTALAATLMARGALGGRILSARLAPAGAETLPRFDVAAHLAALAADPPRWPERTDTVSLLALDLTLAGGRLPDRRVRLELLDYPGEWLLDLPLLTLGFADWSSAVLARLQRPDLSATTRGFLSFATALPSGAAADEALADAGHRLYADMLAALRDTHRLSLLQPGRFLMPPPGPAPPWTEFFPLPGGSPLAGLLARRYDAYVAATRDSLVSPLFGRIDRLVVLADLLGALHTGPAAFEDARGALAASAAALRWQGSWLQSVAALASLRLPPRVISRVVYVASKADHVSERQRGNLAALMGALTAPPGHDRQGPDRPGPGLSGIAGAPRTRSLAVAAIRCTEDFVWTLDGHPVSAVRGRRLGDERMTRSYPGEVPDTPPGPEFWAHPFLALPSFEPAALPRGGRDGVPNIGLDTLLRTLLEDLL